jgi:phage/plasmid-associated DNA primase
MFKEYYINAIYRNHRTMRKFDPAEYAANCDKVDKMKPIKLEDIKFHTEFNDKYLDDLHRCKDYVADQKDYCHPNCKNECYKKQKYYFQQYVCRVRNPALNYIELNDNGEMTVIKPGEMQTRYKPNMKFITRWLKDVRQLSYSKIGFHPDPAECPKESFNTFKGLAVEKIKPAKIKDKDRQKLLDPILEHMYKFFEEKGHADYMMKWAAFLLKYPTKKSKNGVSPSIIGDQGTGKSTFVDLFLVPLIGERYFTYTANVLDIFGEHATGLLNTLLVNFDEVDKAATGPHAQKLKSVGTQTRLTINEKYEKPYQINNYAFIIFTANSWTNSLELGDRRHVVFRTSKAFLNNKEYYKNLSEYMSRPDVQRVWYEYLLSMDVENYDFCANRPQTDDYIQMMEASVSNPVRFMDYVAEGLEHDDEFFIDAMKTQDRDGNDNYKLSAQSLFNEYNKWKAATNHKDEMSGTKFGIELAKISGIRKEKKRGTIFYFFNLEQIREYFQKYGIFQEQAKPKAKMDDFFKKASASNFSDSKSNSKSKSGSKSKTK